MESTMNMNTIYEMMPLELQREMTSYQYSRDYVNYSHISTIDWTDLENHCHNIISNGGGIQLICDVYDNISKIDNVENEVDDGSIDTEKMAFFNNLRPFSLLYDSSELYPRYTAYTATIFHREDEFVIYPDYIEALMAYLLSLDILINEEANEPTTTHRYMTKLNYINNIYYYIVNMSDKFTMSFNQMRMSSEDK